MKTFLKLLGLVVGILAGVAVAVLLAFYVVFPNKTAPVAAPRVNPIVAQGSASLDGHSASWSLHEGMTLVTFTPFLPRNDASLLRMTAHLAQQVFAVDVHGQQPTAEGRNIVFWTPDLKLSVLTGKEDTGEIHSLVMWAERR